MDAGSAERQLAVQELTIQVLKRDLEKEEAARIKEDDNLSEEDEKLSGRLDGLEKRVREMESTARWWLGIAAAAASMLTIGVQFVLKFLPHATGR